MNSKGNGEGMIWKGMNKAVCTKVSQLAGFWRQFQQGLFVPLSTVSNQFM